MKNQQQAEREEQQRIKNLVLNYDLGDDNDLNDGDPNSLPAHQLPLLERNSNTKGIQAPEKRGPPHRDHKSTDKASATRSGFRARKLQLSDVDWYEINSQNRQPQPQSQSQPKSRNRKGPRKSK